MHGSAPNPQSRFYGSVENEAKACSMKPPFSPENWFKHNQKAFSFKAHSKCYCHYRVTMATNEVNVLHMRYCSSQKTTFTDLNKI